MIRTAAKRIAGYAEDPTIERLVALAITIVGLFVSLVVLEYPYSRLAIVFLMVGLIILISMVVVEWDRRNSPDDSAAALHTHRGTRWIVLTPEASRLAISSMQPKRTFGAIAQSVDGGLVACLCEGELLSIYTLRNASPGVADLWWSGRLPGTVGPRQRRRRGPGDLRRDARLIAVGPRGAAAVWCAIWFRKGSGNAWVPKLARVAISGCGSSALDDLKEDDLKELDSEADCGIFLGSRLLYLAKDDGQILSISQDDTKPQPWGAERIRDLTSLWIDACVLNGRWVVAVLYREASDKDRTRVIYCTEEGKPLTEGFEGPRMARQLLMAKNVSGYPDVETWVRTGRLFEPLQLPATELDALFENPPSHLSPARGR